MAGGPNLSKKVCSYADFFEHIWYNKKKGDKKMQLKYHMVTIEDLVPDNHLLRKVESALDLSFVYEETAHLYSRKYGRPAIDPVILVICHNTL